MAERTAEQFYRNARTDLPGPLAGVRVLELASAWAGPMAGCLLADLGADVIRLEMPGNREGQIPPTLPGSELSWFRETLCRNKRSVGIDLRKPGARDLALRLVETADVVVENSRPGGLAKLGLGYEDCTAAKADLVYVSISGWGQFGPDAERPGYDPVAQAMSGWMALNGPPASGPVRTPTFVADDMAALHAALAALAALAHRHRTGEGQHVDVSLLDALLYQSSGLLTLAASGFDLPRRGNRAGFFAPSDAYPCNDGTVVIVVALNRHWRALCGAIGHPELERAPGFATNDERCQNADLIDELIVEWSSPRPMASVLGALQSAGVTAAPVRSFAEAAADPHVRARAAVQEVTLSDGSSAPLAAPAAKLSRTPTRVRNPAPRPGQDTRAVLEELGVPAAEIERLSASGVL